MKRNLTGVIKARPGHLPNFSSAGGYIAFTTILTAPISLALNLISSIIFSLVIRSKIKKVEKNEPDIQSVGMIEFMHYEKKFILITSIISLLIAGYFFYMNMSIIFNVNNSINETISLLAGALAMVVGPFAAVIASSIILAKLIYKKGLRISNIFISFLVYTTITALLIILGNAVLMNI